MHETSFLHNETAQSIREQQHVEFDSDGYYDIQHIYLLINTSELDDDYPPLFSLSWGDRSANITALELQSNAGQLFLL